MIFKIPVAIEKLDGKDIFVTISVGVSLFHPKDKSIEDVISRADKALYIVKKAERTKSVCIILIR
ncbi:MAG: diguanylate cyclase [Treponema sp.]|nr:diguanylate cyclase [Treponema sp.]